MVERKQIEEFASEIARQFSPEKIILFGSYARGTANEDSDVDMLVIMDFDGRERQVVSDIRSKIRSHFPLDLLVRRAPDIEWRIKEDDFFLQEIMEQGKILYAADH
jgi:predicted nucleotidyltransferase